MERIKPEIFRKDVLFPSPTMGTQHKWFTGSLGHSPGEIKIVNWQIHCATQGNKGAHNIVERYFKHLSYFRESLLGKTWFLICITDIYRSHRLKRWNIRDQVLIFHTNYKWSQSDVLIENLNNILWIFISIFNSNNVRCHGAKSAQMELFSANEARKWLFGDDFSTMVELGAPSINDSRGECEKQIN